MAQEISDKERNDLACSAESEPPGGVAGDDERAQRSADFASDLELETQKRLERLTRRRLRSVEPLTAGKVLGHPRYWTFLFLRLYLDECDEQAFHDPEKGYLMAQHAPELARRVKVGQGPERYGSMEEKLSWRVRALAVWGGCCRAFGELNQAGLVYRQAFDLAGGDELDSRGEASSRVDPGARAELHARAAVLCMTRQELGEAVERAGLALDHFESSGDPRRIADVLVIRGLIRYYQKDFSGLEDLVGALTLIDNLDRRSERTLLCALHNTLLILLEYPPSAAQQSFLGQVLRQLKSRLARKPKSKVKTYVLWAEGLNFARLGMGRVAMTRLQRARSSFLAMRDFLDFCVVSIDLACLLVADGADETALLLLTEARQVAARHSCDFVLAELLDLGALRGLSLEKLSHARRRLTKSRLHHRPGTFLGTYSPG